MIVMGKPKFSERNLAHCHFVHNTFDMDWVGMEPEPLVSQTGYEPLEPWQ
jgi:hypothetical protein